MIERADLLVGLSFIAFVPRLNKALAPPPPPPPLAPLSLGTSGDDALSGKKIDKQIKTSVTYFALIREITTKLKLHFEKKLTLLVYRRSLLVANLGKGVYLLRFGPLTIAAFLQTTFCLALSGTYERYPLMVQSGVC